MYRLLYITIGSKNDAIKIAKVIVQEKLAACVNIVDNVTSVYESNGHITSSPEVVMLVKVNHGVILGMPKTY